MAHNHYALEKFISQFCYILKNFFSAFDLQNWYFYAFLYIVLNMGITVTLSDLDWLGILQSVLFFFAFSFPVHVGNEVEIIKWMISISEKYLSFILPIIQISIPLLPWMMALLFLTCIIIEAIVGIVTVFTARA